MRSRPLNRSRLILAAAYGLGGVFVYAACVAPPPVGEIPTVIQFGTTSVSVDPSAFLGAVECSTLPGGMQSYVATVTDQTGGFTLASSPPTACSQAAFFEDIVSGDGFTAEVDGYEEPSDQLVPTCGASPPGTAQTCQTDSDCVPAYGCQGRCLVSLFVNEDYSCLQSCLSQTDAGMPSDQAVRGFASCIATPDPKNNPLGNCASSALGDLVTSPQPNTYIGCVMGCEEGTLGAAVASDFLTCLSNNNDCLLSDIPVLQTECSTAPARQGGGIPSGGVPDGGLDGGGDLVLTGEVQGCGCFYPIAEGDRNMYLRMQKLYCQQDSDCCPPGERCPQGTCHAVQIGGVTKQVCQSVPVHPRWQTTTAPPSAPDAGAVPDDDCELKVKDAGPPICGQQRVIGATQRVCKTDADCPSLGHRCVKDLCTDGFCTPKDPRPCYSDMDCPPSRLCVAGYCDPQVVAYTNTSITPCSVGDNDPDAGATTIQVVAGALLSSSPTEQPGAPVCVGGDLPDGGKSSCNTTVPEGGTGTVTAFDVVPADPTIGSTYQTTGLGCCVDSVVKGLTFTQGVVPDRSYAFTVLAFDGASTPAYSACCYATARAGVEVTAMCDPLAPVGDGGFPPCQ